MTVHECPTPRLYLPKSASFRPYLWSYQQTSNSTSPWGHSVHAWACMASSQQPRLQYSHCTRCCFSCVGSWAFAVRIVSSQSVRSWRRADDSRTSFAHQEVGFHMYYWLDSSVYSSRVDGLEREIYVIKSRLMPYALPFYIQRYCFHPYEHFYRHNFHRLDHSY